MSSLRIQPDLLIGRIAVELKLLTPEALDAALAEQEEVRRQGHRRFLGEILVARGHLTREQLDDILIAQIFAEVRADDTRFGQLAVKNDMATPAQVEECMKKRDEFYGKDREVVCLGQVMRDAGYLNDQQVEALLQAQGRLTRRLGGGPKAG